MRVRVMADEFTLYLNDVHYLSFYLKEKDSTTGSITAYDLTSASSVVLTVRKYGTTINSSTISLTFSSAPTTGYCTGLSTINWGNGKYYSQVEVFSGLEKITWEGPVYIVVGELS